MYLYFKMPTTRQIQHTASMWLEPVVGNLNLEPVKRDLLWTTALRQWVPKEF